MVAPMQVQRPKWRRGAGSGLAVTLGILLAGGVAGCKGNFRDKKQTVFLTHGDAAAYLVQAKESPMADERRRAINRLAQTRYGQDDSALDAFGPIAQNDSSSAVRLAAMLALSKSADPRVARAALGVLEREPAEPAADVRAAAVEALEGCAAAKNLPDDLQPRVTARGIECLQKDRARNVRLGAARLLGYCASREALDALVDALEQRDFGVCYEAERALMRLTGHTFNHDPKAWKEFLAQGGDPFAERGKLDSKLDPPEKNWMTQWRATGD
jgi:hypothetical protein